jgi:hypothetical protein
MLRLVEEKINVVVWALALPVMSPYVTPPSVLTCHCTAGDGFRWPLP